MKRILPFLLCGLLLVLSCEKPGETPPATAKLSVTPNALSFSTDGTSSQTLTVAASAAWTATVADGGSWCSVDPYHGTGGGTVTALPIVETQAGDISAYISTNVISITDGQIFLETELFNSGIMPAVNPGISVSRVGGDAQIKAMKKVAGSLKLLYSQYRELKAFAQFGSDLDEDTKARLALGQRIVEVLKQKNESPVDVAQQVCIIYAVVNGLLGDITVDKLGEFEARLREFMDLRYEHVLNSIRTSGKLDENTENELKKAIGELKSEFLPATGEKA